MTIGQLVIIIWYENVEHVEHVIDVEHVEHVEDVEDDDEDAIGSGGDFFAAKCNKDLGQGKGKPVVSAVAVMIMLMILMIMLMSLMILVMILVMNMAGDGDDILMMRKTKKGVLIEIWGQDEKSVDARPNEAKVMEENFCWCYTVTTTATTWGKITNFFLDFPLNYVLYLNKHSISSFIQPPHKIFAVDVFVHYVGKLLISLKTCWQRGKL